MGFYNKLRPWAQCVHGGRTVLTLIGHVKLATHDQRKESHHQSEHIAKTSYLDIGCKCRGDGRRQRRLGDRSNGSQIRLACCVAVHHEYDVRDHEEHNGEQH